MTTSKDEDRLQRLLDEIQQMRVSRGWDKTDTLPILIKSTAVEAGELLETIQWDEQHPDLEAVKAETADVLMYALSICLDNGWDPERVVAEKIVDVDRRYPQKDS